VSGRRVAPTGPAGGTARVGGRAGPSAGGRDAGPAAGVSSVAYVVIRAPSAYTQCPWAES
jgi:hypothetical protein